jgi:hypothetical protein
MGRMMKLPRDRNSREIQPGDTIIELAGALEVRRILEEIKEVATLHQAEEMPTPIHSAWQTCCEEIFYRATGRQWHMDEDAARFSRLDIYD